MFTRERRSHANAATRRKRRVAPLGLGAAAEKRPPPFEAQDKRSAAATFGEIRDGMPKSSLGNKHRTLLAGWAI
jgi:hypothetical protein